MSDVTNFLFALLLNKNNSSGREISEEKTQSKGETLIPFCERLPQSTRRLWQWNKYNFKKEDNFGILKM